MAEPSLSETRLAWRRRVRVARRRHATSPGAAEARRRELAALAEAVHEGRARVLAERARTLADLAPDAAARAPKRAASSARDPHPGAERS